MAPPPGICSDLDEFDLPGANGNLTRFPLPLLRPLSAHLDLICGHWQLVNKSSDSSEGSLVDLVLRFANCLELALRHAQGMVAAFDHMQAVWRFHLASNALQQIQRTQRVACALHKQDRRSQRAQNFVANFCAITHGAKRIAKTDQAVDFSLERHVTSNTSAHAL